MKIDIRPDICDEIIFQSLYEKHSKNLHDFLYYKYGERLNPGDLAQDAFIKLWENCAKVTPEKARSYLFTIANNSMLNEIKHRKVVMKYNELPSRSSTPDNPEFLLVKEEYHLEYQKVLSELSDEQRTAFMLNKAEGKSHKEISQLLGVTTKVVEYRIYSAFTILKRRLENFNI